jgi:hypothetical protein
MVLAANWGNLRNQIVARGGGNLALPNLLFLTGVRNIFILEISRCSAFLIPRPYSPKNYILPTNRGQEEKGRKKGRGGEERGRRLDSILDFLRKKCGSLI